jgi:probable rRNA maturation factor
VIEVEMLGQSTIAGAGAGAGADAGGGGGGGRADAAAGLGEGPSSAGSAPTFAEVERLCAMAAATAGVHDGHVAIEFVDAERITQLNAEYRRQPTPTDVLSFPVDGVAWPGTRELGDVVICAEHTADLREAVVHGMLHLVGMDHEADNGEMLALQKELLAAKRSERH